MAGPWEKYAATPQETGPWTVYAMQAPAEMPPQPKPFAVLPLREDAQGNVSFDINAGIPGMILRAVRAPYDAMTGKFDPLSPEGRERALETALTISPASPALRAGERLVPGLATSTRREKVAVPTADELKAAARAGYTAARETGAEYPGQTIASAAETAQRGLESEGILAELAPKTFSIISKLQNPPEGAVVTIQSLDAARKALGRIAPTPENKTDYEAARRFIDAIDAVIERMGGSSEAPSVAGASAARDLAAANGAGAGGAAAVDPRAAAARHITEARGNAAARFRSDRITGKAELAENRAAAANSGQNIGNALRQRLVDILASDKLKRGYSPEELAAMAEVVRGTASSNTLRYVSNLLGGGGGIGQAGLGLGGAATGLALGGGPGALVGAALPLVGAASRAGYNALVRRQVRNLDELTRMRSPLYQQRYNAAPLLPEVADQRAALLLRGLLMTGPSGGLLDYSSY